MTLQTAASRPRMITGDPVIDACIAYSKSLTGDVNNLHTELYNGTLTSDEELRERYESIHERIKKVTAILKPAAYDKCNQMTFETAAPIKNLLDAATNGLKQRHKVLLSQIADRFHEDQMVFPIQSSPCFCSRWKRFAADNAGWIVAGAAGTVALTTLTPLGTHIGPIIGNMPKYFGSKGKAIGDFFTSLCESKEFTQGLEAAAPTIGKIALIPAFGYPLYRYFKEPAETLFQTIFGKVDHTMTSASKNPIRTFMVSWVVCYLASRWLGFDGSFATGWAEPFHTRLAVTFVPAAMTPGFVNIAKTFIDEYKVKRALSDFPAIPKPLAPTERIPIAIQTEMPPPSIKPATKQLTEEEVREARLRKLDPTHPSRLPVAAERIMNNEDNYLFPHIF